MGSDLRMAEHESASARLAGLQASLRALLAQDADRLGAQDEALPDWALTWIENALQQSGFRP